MRDAWILVCFAACIAASPGAAFGSHNLVANGDFDSGGSGWVLETESGVSMRWDPAEGDPRPGSLELEGTFMGTGGVLGEALGECFDLPPGHQLELHARVLPETTDGTLRCQPFITEYQLPGCSGSRTQLGSGGLISGQPLGVWQDHGSIFQTAGGGSFRVALALWLLGGEGPATCHFDSVVLAEQGAAGLVEIPAVSPTGRAALIAALLAAAAWLLRRSP